MGLVPLQERVLRIPCLFYQLRTQCREAGSGPLPNTECAGTLISDFPASSTVKTKCLLFKPPSVWYSVIAAWTDYERRKYFLCLLRALLALATQIPQKWDREEPPETGCPWWQLPNWDSNLIPSQALNHLRNAFILHSMWQWKEVCDQPHLVLFSYTERIKCPDCLEKQLKLRDLKRSWNRSV